jgi:hypothetical protein
MRPAARKARIGWLSLSDVDFTVVILSPSSAQIAACSFSSSAANSAGERRARFFGAGAERLFRRCAPDVAPSTRRTPRRTASAAVFSRLAMCSRTTCSTFSSIPCSSDLFRFGIQTPSHNFAHELKEGTARL